MLFLDCLPQRGWITAVQCGCRKLDIWAHLGGSPDLGTVSSTDIGRPSASVQPTPLQCSRYPPAHCHACTPAICMYTSDARHCRHSDISGNRLVDVVPAASGSGFAACLAWLPWLRSWQSFKLLSTTSSTWASQEFIAKSNRLSGDSCLSCEQHSLPIPTGARVSGYIGYP